jgi:hypothetical protein
MVGCRQEKRFAGFCQHRQPVQRLRRVSGTLGGPRQVGRPLQFQFQQRHI